jgi:hypothetical protein
VVDVYKRIAIAGLGQDEKLAEQLTETENIT